MEEVNKVYIVFREGKPWTGSKYKRHVRAYTSYGTALGVIKKKLTD